MSEKKTPEEIQQEILFLVRKLNKMERVLESIGRKVGANVNI